jgi:tripartite-type tricarboxylate transporter receptor subunit TctC
MEGKRVRIVIAAVSVALLGCAGPTWAQQYPTKPVKVIVPFTAGGPTDIVARLIGQRLSEALGQQFLIDNRPGTNVGVQLAARAPADGYTLFLSGVATLAITPHVQKRVPFDPFKDLVMISLLTVQPVMLMVHPALPVRSVKEFIALARSRPGQLDYASSGIGGSGHLAGELFQTLTNTRMEHIPYKGAAPALTDLTAGQVQVMFGTLLAAVPLVHSGRVRPLAVTGQKRSVPLPEVPTFVEVGMPTYDAVSWNAMLAPTGTPAEAVTRLNAALLKIVRDPSVLDRLSGDGVVGTGSTPQEATAYLKSEYTKWGKVVHAAGIAGSR